jgi:hypothetical protein
MRRAIVCCLVVAATVVLKTHVDAQEPKPKPKKRNFQPRRLLREQPPIVQFEVKDADEVVNTLDEMELVIGVVIGEEARAYPINMLTGPRREIINDRLGETAIAATW